MNLFKYLTLLVVFLISDGDAGGHGEGHHDHVKLYMPEFIHHDRHTKVITIHHHHHKPKEEEHHHHLNLDHKPHVPYGHHYHNHHTKLKTTITTVSKGKQKHHGLHGRHGHHGHHGSHGHHGHNGHHGYQTHHDPIPHYDAPAINYVPPSHSYNAPSYNSYSPPSSTFEEDFASLVPAAPAYTGHIGSQQPRIHGVTHTVKQVNVFDSLAGSLPSSAGKPVTNSGYEVNEPEDDDDAFTVVNSLQQSYPGTYGFVNGADQASHDHFSEATPQVGGVAGLTGGQTHDPFASVAQPTFGHNDIEAFGSTAQGVPFSSLSPEHSEGYPSVQSSAGFPDNFHADGNSDVLTPTSFIGSTGAAFAVADHENDDTAMSFSSEAGIQQNYNTGGVETVGY